MVSTDDENREKWLKIWANILGMYDKIRSIHQCKGQFGRDTKDNGSWYLFDILLCCTCDIFFAVFSLLRMVGCCTGSGVHEAG